MLKIPVILLIDSAAAKELIVMVEKWKSYGGPAPWPAANCDGKGGGLGAAEARKSRQQLRWKVCHKFWRFRQEKRVGLNDAEEEEREGGGCAPLGGRGPGNNNGDNN